MSAKLIGYVEVYAPPGGCYYNFWPKLMWSEETGAWTRCPDPLGQKFFTLTGENYSCANVSLTNSEVICVTCGEEDLNQVNKLFFPNDEAEACIRPASDEGFLPVLSISSLLYEQPILVREHISLNAGNNEEDPKIPPTGKTRQKGRAYVNGRAIVRYGNWFYSPSRVVESEQMHSVTLSIDTVEYRLKAGAELWDIFENPLGYVFPRYVFRDDLEPADAQPEPEEEPAPDAEEVQPEEETAPDAEDAQPGEEAAADAEDAQPEQAAPDAEAAQPEVEAEVPGVLALGREELAGYLYESIREYRPNYTRNDILNIAINLTQNFLTVFSGEPGTGKTSICNIFAQALGLRGTDRYVPVSVERGWTSKRDFIGYYNPLSSTPENPIEAANARLYRALADSGREGDTPELPLLILLDEANLSPMEYYWSDFMNIAGGDADEVDRVINLGGGAKELTISPACRFAATINSDHTTEDLSPRIIDRSAVIVLPSGEYAPGKKLSRTGAQDRPAQIGWSSLQAAFGGGEEQQEDLVLDAYRAVKAKLAEKPLRTAVSFRVEQAVRRFCAAARQEGVFSGSQEERDAAAQDCAVAQRLLPKLSGSGEEYLAALKELQQLCRDSGLNKSAGLLEQIIQRGGDSALSYYSFF